MARPKKVLTPAEVKATIKELKAALKANNDGLKPYKEAVTAAVKTYSAKAKEAGNELKALDKVVVAAHAKLEKATAAAAKGAEKINTRLAELAGTSADKA